MVDLVNPVIDSPNSKNPGQAGKTGGVIREAFRSKVISVDTEPLLGSILDELKQTVDYQSAAIVVLTGGQATVLAFRGSVSQEKLFDWSILLQETWIKRTIVTEHQPVIVTDLLSETDKVQAFRAALRNGSKDKNHYPRSWMGIPLIVKGKGIGMLSVTHQKPNYYRANDAEEAGLFAQQIGVALEHDHLYQQALHLATLTERHRLAREMHDQLAQALGFINLKASLTIDLLNQGQVAEAQANLKELKGIARDTYTDVREEIFNLRTEMSPDKQFMTTLQEYLSKYQEQYGIEAQLMAEEESSSVEFPATVSSQLIRIIQEALSNSRKHAQAGQVIIRFSLDNKNAHLIIEDDGQGFEPAQVLGKNNKSFGLQIMLERAESVGGSLEIDSMPGRGTRLMLTLPK